MSNKEDLVYVNCFYYGFYMKRNELSKYNIKSEQLVEVTKKIINENKNSSIRTNIQISDSLFQNIYNNLNISFYIFHNHV